MSYEYTSATKRNDKWSLPDVEVFQLTAHEAAAQDEDLIWEYSRKPQFRLCHMNSRTREAMLDAIVENEGITGGWFWWTCLPGCLPDSSAFGPFKTYAEALQDAKDSDGELEPDEFDEDFEDEE